MAQCDYIIELKDLHKSFKRQKVLEGTSLRVLRGIITVIIGRSGSGKSVLLKHIIGLIQPDRGQVLLDGQDITLLKDHELNALRRRFGMLFQDAALFDSMSVGDNVAFPLREHTKLSEQEVRRAVAEKLAMVGLAGVEEKMPNELSGGMRKRAGLARAMALAPEIILYDEPTTGLDPLLTDAITRLIKQTGQCLGITSVVISHDIAGAFAMADQIAMLYRGRIIAADAPEKLKASDNPVVQQFIHGRAKGPIDVL
jgi:phospholipid/cholesterol/gamma-HCH transport system ATP-binding protein